MPASERPSSSGRGMEFDGWCSFGGEAMSLAPYQRVVLTEDLPEEGLCGTSG